MSGSIKAAAVDFSTFSSRLIALIDVYCDRFWGETGAVVWKAA
jgi:hypothetical protein